FSSLTRLPPRPPLFPYTTLFRSVSPRERGRGAAGSGLLPSRRGPPVRGQGGRALRRPARRRGGGGARLGRRPGGHRARVPDSVVQLLRHLEPVARVSQRPGSLSDESQDLEPHVESMG